MGLRSWSAKKGGFKSERVNENFVDSEGVCKNAVIGGERSWMWGPRGEVELQSVIYFNEKLYVGHVSIYISVPFSKSTSI